MNRISGLLALVLAILAGTAPALAADFVQDGAGMFKAGTISTLTSELSAFNAESGKSVVVVTVPSLNGEALADAAQKVFTEQKINGILIFIARDDRKDFLLPGTDTAYFFPEATIRSIRTSMESQFKDGDFDGGITTAVSGILNIFEAHLNTANTQTQNAYPASASRSVAYRSNGVHISMFMWIVIIVIGYLILKSIFRAMSGPRYYGGGPGAGGPGGPGYGGGGYYGGGGGGFWSGMLGGLGGAFLGNELFGNHGTQIIDPNTGALQQGDQGGGWGGGNAGGWGNDGGQADTSAGSGGDFSGGGFGGDSGGGFGGGGDFGGGGGDSGGGW